MGLVLHHAPEVIGQPAADGEDGEHLEEVGERRGVLEGVRGVGVRIAAAVGAEHLDGDLRGHRALDDGLLGHGLLFHHGFAIGAFDGLALVVLLLHRELHRLQQLGLGVRLEVLDHALRHEKHGEHQADGQQQVIGRPHEVHPEVAQGLGRVPGEAAHERRGDGDAGGRGDEVVKGQRDHLREIRHGGFAAVALPVGVGREADRGVERQVRD